MTVKKIFESLHSLVIYPVSVLAHSNLIGLFMEMMKKSMDKYYNTLRFNGRNIRHESYCFNIVKCYLFCDEKFRLLEKDKDGWDKFMEEYQLYKD